MPDAQLVLRAMWVSAVAAAAVFLLCGWTRRSPHSARVQLGWVLGIGLAFFVGGLVLEVRLRWPPQEDQQRLLVLLLPAVVAVECVGAFARTPQWLRWTLRTIIAFAAARVLLDRTTYLADLAGPDTREWTPAQAWCVLGGLGLALIAVWALLERLARRTPGPWLPLALACACASAAVVIMLSGYLTGGRLGLALAAALAGAALSALALPPPRSCTGAIGVGVVGLFSLLVIGRFFGQLTTPHAVLLLCAPLLCWLPELPYVRRLPAGGRGLLMVALVALPLSVIRTEAHHKQDDASLAPGTPAEPTLQDYLEFKR
jgi:hypothetical protein